MLMHSRGKSSVMVRHLIRRPLASPSLTSPGSSSGWHAWRQRAEFAHCGTSWPCCACVPPSPARGRGDTPSCDWCLETRCAACHAHGNTRSAAAAWPRRGCARAAKPCRHRAAAAAPGIAGEPRTTAGPALGDPGVLQHPGTGLALVLQG